MGRGRRRGGGSEGAGVEGGEDGEVAGVLSEAIAYLGDLEALPDPHPQHPRRLPRQECPAVRGIVPPGHGGEGPLVPRLQMVDRSEEVGHPAGGGKDLQSSVALIVCEGTHSLITAPGRLRITLVTTTHPSVLHRLALCLLAVACVTRATARVPSPERKVSQLPCRSFPRDPYAGIGALGALHLDLHERHLVAPCML